jgi:DNA-binding XRE family transcriptional regulator
MTLPSTAPTGWWPCERCHVSPWPEQTVLTRRGYLCALCRGVDMVAPSPPPKILPSFGNLNPSLIKSARKEAGLSVVQLAVRLGRSGRTIEGWEDGKRRPDNDTLAAISTALGCPARKFFEEAA